MNATQQHMLDAYRAAQRDEAVPILPGTGTAQAAREIHRWRRFQAVITDPADRLPGRVGRGLRAVGAALGLGPRLPLPPPTPTHPEQRQPSVPHRAAPADGHPRKAVR
ncbi:hypothetical protein ACIQNI_09540 [Streptomyces sp. NPDC091266]|uniref:hypothetical protein n=1 Tax=Streptomyces sp. NPDC091266 TaxID=3365978 RepID=UPI003810107F